MEISDLHYWANWPAQAGSKECAAKQENCGGEIKFKM